jgi:hypothetical protein
MNNPVFLHITEKKINVYTNIKELHVTHPHRQSLSNRSHKEIKAVFTKNNRVAYFNLNFNCNFYYFEN